MKVIALNMRRVYTKLVGLVYDLLASDHSSPRVSTSRPPNGLELPAPCSVRGALGKSPGHPTGALEIQQDKQARGPAKSRSWYRTAVAGSALEDRLPRLLFGGPFAPYALSGGSVPAALTGIPRSPYGDLRLCGAASG